MIEIKKTSVGYVPDPVHGDMRIPQPVWNRYVAAKAKLAAAISAMETAAVRPVYVTPDQEEAIRAAVKPGTWIVVRVHEPISVAAPAETLQEQAVTASVEEGGSPPPFVAAGPPERPRPGRCAARGGLPHTSLRYVYTDAPSVYDPGRVRVDGLCQCGERIVDVKCPHMKTELNQQRQVACRNCRAQLGSSAGAIDNRNLAWGGMSSAGASNPHVPLPVPAFSDEAPRDAYRAPGA